MLAPSGYQPLPPKKIYVAWDEINNEVSVLIGCSGWSYEDWVGRFYPVALARKKEEWLRYYASYFNTVEINSTFYRLPNEFMVNGWIKKGLTLKGFEYSAKMPQAVTHELMVRMEGAKAGIQATVFEETCVKPLAENGLLGTVLVQLSPRFEHGGRSVEALREVLDALDTDKYRYAVEFRHRSWTDNGSGRLQASAAGLLRDRNVANVLVDGPGFPLVAEMTADHAYIRFHGRNYDIWFDEEREEDIRQSRYDYLYNEEELRPWKDMIDGLSSKVKDVRVYFNNNGRAKGAKNAFQLMDMLSIPHRGREIQVQDQATLGSFLMYKK